MKAAVAAALAQIRKLQEVLAHGAIVKQKDFLRGLVAGITLYPSRHEGVIRFYDRLLLAGGGPDSPTAGLPPASLEFIGWTPEDLEKMQVLGATERFRWRLEGWRQAA